LKRTFAAIKVTPDDKFNAAFDKIRHELEHEKIKWLDPEIMHVTIRFFGDTEDEQVRLISSALDDIARDNDEFEINVKGSGVFRNLKNPRVIWLGIEDKTELINVKKSLDIRLEEKGFTGNEPAAYNPHLTIGRMKFVNTDVIKRFIEDYNSFLFLKVKVGEILYYESVQGAKGHKYEILSRHALRD
jgi:2'-5' RNA ligase